MSRDRAGSSRACAEARRHRARTQASAAKGRSRPLCRRAPPICALHHGVPGGWEHGKRLQRDPFVAGTQLVSELALPGSPGPPPGLRFIAPCIRANGGSIGPVRTLSTLSRHPDGVAEAQHDIGEEALAREPARVRSARAPRWRERRGI